MPQSSTTAHSPNDGAKPSPTQGFRFSLRSMLLVLIGSGVYVGLMGRLFVRRPGVFRFVWTVSTTVMPFALAIATLIYFCVKAERKRGLVVWTIFLSLAPVFGLLSQPLFPYLRSFLAPVAATGSPSTAGPFELNGLTTTQLIEDQLPIGLDDPWVWQELEKRTATMSAAEADEITLLLVDHMKSTKPKGWDEPLLFKARFFQHATESNLISQQTLTNMLDAYNGYASLRVDRARESSKQLAFRVSKGHNWSNNHQFFPKLLWELSDVTIDGQNIDFRLDSKHGDMMSGTYEESLSKGAHEIKVVIDCVYVDPEKMLGLELYRLKREDWPKPIKAWQETVAIPFHVYSKDEQFITMIKDPDKSPKNAFHPKIAVQNQGAKKKFILEMAMDVIPIDISFAVAAVNGETVIELGKLTRGVQCSRIRTLPTLDPALRFVNLVLTPDPEGIERNPVVHEMWGEEIILKRVPVERFDLETE